MNAPKVKDLDYLQFLIAAQRVFTCTEAATCPPQPPDPPAPDAVPRRLSRPPPDPAALWQEGQPWIRCQEGALILEDRPLDKPDAPNMALVTGHGRGKHHRVVRGINRIRLVWTDGDRWLPGDFRLDDQEGDGLDKPAPARAVLAEAQRRGFRPQGVLFEGGQAAWENRKARRGQEWRWLTRLKSHRLVNPDDRGHVPIETVAIPREGRGVPRKGSGFVRVFRTVAKDGEAEYGATRHREMSEAQRVEGARQALGIAVYQRGIKQCGGIEKSPGQTEPAPRGPIPLARRALVRWEAHGWQTGTSWEAAKTAIIRAAVRDFLTHPLYTLASDPTA